jgi:O-antigen/teichoic acid export membrane protein
MTENTTASLGPRRPAFASSAALTFGAQLLAALLGFANVLLMSRVLGADGRGQVAYLVVIAVLTSAAAVLGIDQANVNIASRERALRSHLLANSIVFSALFSTLAVAVVSGLMIAFPALDGGLDASLRWAAIGVTPVLVLNIYLHSLAQADYRFALVTVAFLIPPIATLILNGALAVVDELTVASVIGVWIGAQVASTALLLVVLYRSFGLASPDVRLARRSIGFGLKIYPGGIINTANYRLDQWILGGVAGARELGLYSVAVAWAETLFYLPTALALVQRPDLVRATPAEAPARAAAVFRVCMLATIPLAIVVVILAPFLCTTIFGDEFSGSVDDLRVLAAGALGVVAMKLLADALAARGRPLLTTLTLAVGLIVTVALDLILIPRLEGLGAAIASTSAYIAAGLTAILFFKSALDGSGRSLIPRVGDVSELTRQVREFRLRTLS